MGPGVLGSGSVMWLLSQGGFTAHWLERALAALKNRSAVGCDVTLLVLKPHLAQAIWCLVGWKLRSLRSPPAVNLLLPIDALQSGGARAPLGILAQDEVSPVGVIALPRHHGKQGEHSRQVGGYGRACPGAPLGVAGFRPIGRPGAGSAGIVGVESPDEGHGVDLPVGGDVRGGSALASGWGAQPLPADCGR